MNILFEAPATAIGGRTGSVATADGMLRIALAEPGKGGAGRASPEQLFASGFAACFLAAMRAAAGRLDLELAHDANVTATVGVGQRPEGAGLEIVRVALSIDLPTLAPDEAEALVAEARRVCAFSQATRGNIQLDIDIS